MSKLRSKDVFLITGATGFIASIIIEELMSRLEFQKGNIHIIAIVRNKKKLIDEFKKNNSPHITWLELDITQKICLKKYILDTLNLEINYIIHCASVTKSSAMLSQPVEVADGIVLGTKNILDLARRDSVESVVYLSSMEVYGKVEDTGVPLSEDKLGYISLTSSRSCYPIAKRMAEHYCHLYWREFGVPVKIARLAQTFGTGVSPKDERVFVQFARAVVENKDIVLRTAGTSMGNYCASEDALRAIFTILLKGVNGEVYNVTNEANTMRIREMAELVVTKIAKGHIKVQYDLDYCNTYGYPPDTGLRLSAMKLRKLGWQPTKELEEMYGDLIRELQ